MKKLLLAFLIIAPAAVIAQAKVINDPNAEERAVSSFTSISISDAFDLYLTQSDKETVAVSADKIKYRDRIKVEVQGNVLKISYDKDGRLWRGDNKKLKAYVSFKTLQRLKAGGACDIYVDGTINAVEFELRLSGASDFKKGSINAQSLTVTLSGASRARISGGQVTRMDVEASGASDFHGYDLVTDNCRADAHGASSINITVNKELSAKASGASGIHYKGEAVIKEVRSSGASSISKRS